MSPHYGLRGEKGKSSDRQTLRATYYVNQKITDTQKWRSNLCQELEFARICQWDFVSVVFIFQFVIQQAQFQHVDLSRKCFDSFMDYYLGILTHAETIGDCMKRVIK